jgi:hypothetical protein
MGGKQGEHAGGFAADDVPRPGKGFIEQPSGRLAGTDGFQKVGDGGDAPQAVKQSVHQVGRQGRR